MKKNKSKEQQQNQESAEIDVIAHSRPLGEKLWEEIEALQGHAFISDSILYATDEQVKNVARGALEYAKQIVKILKKFSSA